MSDITVLSIYRQDDERGDNLLAFYVDGNQLWWDSSYHVDPNMDLIHIINKHLPLTSLRYWSFQGEEIDGVVYGEPWFLTHDPPETLDKIPPEVIARMNDLSQDDA